MHLIHIWALHIWAQRAGGGGKHYLLYQSLFWKEKSVACWNRHGRIFGRCSWRLEGVADMGVVTVKQSIDVIINIIYST